MTDALSKIHRTVSCQSSATPKIVKHPAEDKEEPFLPLRNQMHRTWNLKDINLHKHSTFYCDEFCRLLNILKCHGWNFLPIQLTYMVYLLLQPVCLSTRPINKYFPVTSTVLCILTHACLYLVPSSSLFISISKINFSAPIRYSVLWH